MRRKLKIFFLTVCKTMLLFDIARHLTRNYLRILCYHGFSNNDECRWMPGVFMHPKILAQRLGYLRTEGYAIVSLTEAVSQLKRGKLGPHSVVITIDDGFQSVLTLAHPILADNSVPYTIYLATYYCNKDIPIANLLVQYGLWKTRLCSVKLKNLGIDKNFDLTSPLDRDALYTTAFGVIDKEKSEEKKSAMMSSFLKDLGLEDSDILERNTLKILRAEQIKHLANQGVDFQLHTHRHNFPNDSDVILDEILLNKKTIEYIVGISPTHLSINHDTVRRRPSTSEVSACQPSRRRALEVSEKLRRTSPRRGLT
jgi:peptidoglycan/xylan/chitin deacetylase (PgdA/CDA1 family)